MSKAFPFGMTVPRLCRIRTDTESDETPFPLDFNGFLDASSLFVASEGETLFPGMLVSPERAAEAGALVLLGEPGVGKTTVFNCLTAGLPEADEATDGEPARLLVDGALLTDSSFEELLGAYLSRLPDRLACRQLAAQPTQDTSYSPQRQATLTLVLDQVDESTMLPRLAARLGRALRRRDTSRLRLLLGCRTADYRRELTEVLSHSFGRCFLVDLAPLTRAQAEALAASCGVDGVALIGAAVAAGAGALASVPLTLELLVKVYREHGRLDGRPANLFARGVRLLAEEPDEARRREVAGSVDQRLAVAGRAAARLLLSGGRTVWSGSDLDANRLDLPAGSLFGGNERTPNGPFEVTQAVVSATLGTPLLTGSAEGRLAFRHSSLAAYLAAYHLWEHQIPEAQLRSLFLVAGDDATTSIPVALRETAAWLVTLDPSHSRWLVDADPASLAGHSAIVDSPDMRMLVVDALFVHASEVELADSPWVRARWQLAHPGLANQLAPVLTGARVGEPEDWQAQARVRLAVRLAQQAAAPELADPLLALAEHDGWSAYVRQLAVRAALAAGQLTAVPRLQALLGRLRDETYARTVDGEDQLRGVLLELLWPQHLTLDEVLPHLRPRQHRYLFGTYLMFLHAMPDGVEESELGRLLRWTRDQVSADRASDFPSDGMHVGETGIAATTPTPAEADTAAGPLGPLMDMELLQAIVNRALAGASASAHVEDVAAVLWPRLQQHDHLELPTPVDVVDANGNEPEHTRRLRRALARALTALVAQEGVTNPGICLPVVQGWRGRSAPWGPRPGTKDDVGLRPAHRQALVGPEDFPWALDAADEARKAGDEQLAKALGALAYLILDPTDLDSQELAYRRHDSPAWEYLRWAFEEVRLDSDYARMMRETVSSAGEQDRGRWPAAEQFASVLRDRLSAAAAGDTDAFWRLLWDLQIDPATGTGRTAVSDDLFSFPAVPMLGNKADEKIRQAAAHYLQAEHDRADSWLGTNRYDRRAWAGYLAFAALDEAGQLDNLPANVWGAWAGALLWFHAANASTQARKRRLLAWCALHAPTEMAGAVARLVRGDLARSQRPFAVELVDPTSSSDLVDTLAALVGELSKALADLPDVEREAGEPIQPPTDTKVSATGAAVPEVVTLPSPASGKELEALEAVALDTWESMLRLLVRTDSSSSIILAQGTIRSAGDRARQRHLAVRAARILLVIHGDQFWEQIKTALECDVEFSRELALACAMDESSWAITNSFDEASLGDLHRWLTGLFPVGEDIPRLGASYVTPDQEARDWRDRVLRVLGDRGTPAAVSVLTQLAAEAPNDLRVAAALLVARAKVQASGWSPPSANEVAALLADGSRRLVRDSAEFANLILDTLTDVEKDLPSHGELLWDRRRPEPVDQDIPVVASPAGDLWQPKPEAALSAYLAHELTLRLHRRGIAVNREVLIRPSNAYGAGDRTDIKADATAIHHPFALESTAVAAPLTVVIEVKGAWNLDLMTAQRSQLAQQYLPEAHADAGIYFVGWYAASLWNAPHDHRKNAAARLSKPQVEQALRRQASEIGKEFNLRVDPILVTIPRPRPRPRRPQSRSDHR